MMSHVGLEAIDRDVRTLQEVSQLSLSLTLSGLGICYIFWRNTDRPKPLRFTFPRCEAHEPLTRPKASSIDTTCYRHLTIVMFDHS